MTETIDQILLFWFGPLNKQGLSATEQHGLWFKSSENTDKEIAELFAGVVEQALSGALDDWANSDRGLLALILLLDQFTRNIYRGTPEAFSGDSRALGLARAAIAKKRQQNMPLIHRVFLYLPLEHSEDLNTQQQCVALYDEMATATGLDQMAGFLRYAAAHCDVIEKFGRFPHRNAILGRPSTVDEIQHIKTHGGF